jgi:hypothetical protein
MVDGRHGPIAGVTAVPRWFRGLAAGHQAIDFHVPRTA